MCLSFYCRSSISSITGKWSAKHPGTYLPSPGKYSVGGNSEDRLLLSVPYRKTTATQHHLEWLYTICSQMSWGEKKVVSVTETTPIDASNVKSNATLIYRVKENLLDSRCNYLIIKSFYKILLNKYVFELHKNITVGYSELRI